MANTVIYRNIIKMGIVERRQRQKEEVRRSILRAAWAIVKKEGWQALSIRKIADAIEYSVPVIYSHFENKDAILMEFIREGYRRLTRQMKKAKNKHADPAYGLEDMGYTYWNFAFNNKEYYQLMFGMGIPSCPQAENMPEMAGFGDTIRSTLEEIIPESCNQHVDVLLKFKTFWSILHGLVSINMMDHTPAEDQDELNQQILKDAIAGFIKGLKP